MEFVFTLIIVLVFYPSMVQADDSVATYIDICPNSVSATGDTPFPTYQAEKEARFDAECPSLSSCPGFDSSVAEV